MKDFKFSFRIKGFNEDGVLNKLKRKIKQARCKHKLATTSITQHPLTNVLQRCCDNCDKRWDV